MIQSRGRCVFFLKKASTSQVLELYRERYAGIDVCAVDEAFRLLRHGSQLVHTLKTFFDCHGMTSTRFMVMIVIDLAAEQGGLLPGEVAARLDVSRTVATEAINALVRRGLLTSAPRGGVRSRSVTLTSDGQVVLGEQLPKYLSLIADFMRRNRIDAAS